MIDWPIAWTIAGTDPSGGAGIQADLKVFHALRVYGGSAITAVVAQNTRGVRWIQPVAPDVLGAQIDALAEDLPPSAVKIGMLATADLVRETARRLAGLAAPIVCDPVMASSGGAPLLDAEGRRALVDDLLPQVAVVTPNLPEASRLCGFDIATQADMLRAADRILALGARAVLLKGGHAASPAESIDLLASAETRQWLSSPRQAVRHTHGTGCTLSAAIAAFLSHGQPLASAALLAKAYVNQGLRMGGGIGRGHGPLAHAGWPHSETDLPRVESVGAMSDGQRTPP